MGRNKTQIKLAAKLSSSSTADKIEPSIISPVYHTSPKTVSAKLANSRTASMMGTQDGIPGRAGQAKITALFQRQIGNTGVARMFRESSLQAKLAMGSPNDIYEKEADQIAEDVVSGRVSRFAAGSTARPLSRHAREDKQRIAQKSRPAIQRSPGLWRYKPPATVLRTIEDMQAVVGTTPDGIYGPRTRAAVKRYQTKLKAEGLYAKKLDGKWGDFTEAGHVEFATGMKSETYNCAGLAFKTYDIHDMAETNTILAGMTALPNCGDKCKSLRYKFWYWEYDVSLTNLATGVTSPVHRDFHIVGGQTNWKGEGPNVVVSKNGRRPVKGPAPPASWKPVTAPARVNDHTDAIVPGFRKNRTNHTESCYCSKTLP